jgi:tripartite-type tricarboxylate transporter receptor subunit TctC
VPLVGFPDCHATRDVLRKLATVLMICVALISGAALAQGNAPLRIVIAFPPGGPVDFVARVLAQGLAEDLGVPAIVDNRPGANGAISAQAVAKAAPDGATLWFTSIGAVAMNPALYDNLTYDMQRDFAPVSLVVNNVEVLVVNPANPAANAVDFVAQSKQSRDPVPIASSGIGSMPHLAMELLADSSGARLLHVPYKGAAPAITDVMAGQVSGFFGDVPGLIGFIRAGKLKAIGIASASRHPLLPDVRTLDEQGIHGVESNNWYALFAPARTPPARIEQLNAAVRRVLTSDAYRKRLLESGAEPAPSTPQQLAALVVADTARWGRIIRDKTITGD